MSFFKKSADYKLLFVDFIKNKKLLIDFVVSPESVLDLGGAGVKCTTHLLRL